MRHLVQRVWPVLGLRERHPRPSQPSRLADARPCLACRLPPSPAVLSVRPHVLSRRAGNQASKKHDLEDSKFDGFVDDAEPAGPAVKKARVDYSAFKADVSRLQKNLENFENDLKEHSMQVQQKLAFILSALDEAAVPPQAPPAATNGSPAPMPAARDLQPHGATADALAAAAATAMPTDRKSVV